MVNSPIIDQVDLPSDLRQLSDSQLASLARELRAETISIV